MAKLGDICTINMGQSPESSSYNTIGDGLPFFQGNADFGDVHPTIRTWCSNPIKIAQKDDILISVRAPIGALNIANQRCCIGRGLASLTNYAKKIYRDYLWFALFSKIDELNTKGTGSTFKAINKKILAETDIPLPSPERQEQIVKQLSCLDTLLSRNKQQLSKLDQLVKSRFIEMFGDEKFFQNWETDKIGNIADICVGVVIKPSQYYTLDTKTGIKAFRSLNIGEMHIKNKDWVYFTKEGHQKNSKSIIKENDVLIVRSGSPGTACVATKEYADYNAIDIIIARPNCKKINPVFLAMFTNMPHGMNQIQENTGGAAQQHFNVGGYKNITIILPPLSLQEQFASFVQQVDKIKSSVKQSLEKLETLKNSLMQEYFG